MIANIFEIPLSEHAKKINEAFYFKVFQRKPQAKTHLYSIPEKHISQGARHAARVAIYIRILINFFRAKGYSEALVLAEEDVFLLQIAALMYGASQFDDYSIETITNESTQQYCLYLKQYGVSEEKIRYFSDLVVQKEKGNFLGKILQASESLDIMRCKTIFCIDQLEILSVVKAEHRGFLLALIDEIGQFIANQYDMKEDVVVSFQGQIIYRYQKTRDPSRPEIKESYEYSENCFLKTCEETEYYLLLSKYFRDNSLFKLSSGESETDVMDNPNDVTRKRKLEKLDAQGNNIESVNLDLEIKQFAQEVENELQVEEESAEPILKKTKQEEVRSEAYTHGYQNGLSRIELTSNPIKSITVPKKYIKEEDKRDFRLGYKEGHEFMTKSLAEDEPIFYALGQENGEKYALKTYDLNKDPHPFLDQKRTSIGLHLLCFNKIYQLVVQSKLTDIYEKGFHLGYYYYWDLLDSYYQNYLKAYSVVIEKKFPAIVVIEPFQKENLTPLQREGIRQQAIAGYEEGTKFANLVISNNCQKNHLAFFKLQIQRLTKLYEEGNVSWSRQRALIAELHPKAWENRGYILRNYFCPKHIEYLNTSSDEWRDYSKRVVQYGYACKEEAISHFIFFQLLVGEKFEIIVTDDHVKIMLHTMYHNELSRLRSVDSLAKSVRWDDKIFFDEFLLSITKSPINQPEEKLRKGRHKKYTVFGHGFFLRSEKVSPYNLPTGVLKRKKLMTSLHQSTSLITKDDQPIFGHIAFRRNKLVGYMFKPSKLINRIFFKDMGTINRPYEFDNLQEAEAYFNQKVLGPTPTMFKTLAELKQHIIKDKKSHNEVLARLKWTINTSCIAIFSDTFEARCIAQFYAKLTYRRLLYQYRELNQTLPQDYKVPIIFYLPGSPLNWQIYSPQQQANDKIKAEKMFSDEAKIKEAFDQNNFEFLLLLDDLDHLSYQNLPVLFWCAYAYSLNIAEVLYQQTNSCFLISFEEYLKDTLLNIWRFESNCLYVERRNIFLSTALKLGIKDLPKEILKTKLIDEDNSNQYGNSLFQLVDAKEFELLTEIVVNQKIDLDRTNEVGDTLLHFAARANHLELVKLMIEKGAKISVFNKYYESPLITSIQKQIDNSEMVRLFLGHNTRDEIRAMGKACSVLNLHVLKTFFPLKDRFGLSVGPELYNLLLYHVILVPLRNNVDREAQIQIVRILLQAGADPAYPYPLQGKSALQLAEEKALVDIVKELEASINKPGALPFISK